MRWTMHIGGGPRRVNHAAVAVGDFIYSFGGYCTGECYTIHFPIDVHVLNTKTLRWTSLPRLKNANGITLRHPDVPFRRYGHTVVTYNSLIYLWGGRSDDSLCNVLYCYDPKTLNWSIPLVTGLPPSPRDGHTACVVGNCMYIYGGFLADINEFSGDVNCFNMDTLEWRYVQTFENSPSYRDFHSAVAFGDRMYVFGGRGDKNSPTHSDQEIYCDQIVYLDLKTMAWHAPAVTGKVPLGRRSHSMFVYNDIIYIFGGYNGTINEHFNDMYTFEPSRCRWNRVEPHGIQPIRRRRHCAIMVHTQLFLFGGTSPSNDEDTTMPFLEDFNDTHVLDFEPSLKTLAMLAVLDYNLDITDLPNNIRHELRIITQLNKISRPINQNG